MGGRKAVRHDRQHWDGSVKAEHALFWDERLVNKLATLLAILDQNNVPHSQVVGWVKANGGARACIHRFRSA